MFRGHLWTLRPFLGSILRPPVPPAAHHFRTWVQDPTLGKVRLTGRLAVPADANGAVLIVHGLGGSARAPYMAQAAAAAYGAGLAALRLNLRGADRTGEDFYHAGLTADLAAALSSPELAPFEHIYVLGFSLGGHVTLRLATVPHDARLRAIAAVCSPIDLARSAEEIDRPQRALYRKHVLGGLKEIYREVHLRRGGPASIEEANGIKTLREWDERIVAPRHGFAGADDYWAKTSVHSRLGRVRLPTLVVQSEADPMVLAHTVRPALERAKHIDTRWVAPDRGGHVGFPRDLQLGVDAPAGLADQVIGWLKARGDALS